MPASLVTYERHGNGGVITLDRPQKRNALSRALLADLSDAVEHARQDAGARLVVLQAKGTAFCAGMDLAEMLETRDALDAEARWQADADAYRELLLKIACMSKPTLAVVQGPALAGGMGLVLACDMVIASETARFGLPEPKRGLVAAVVAPFLLLRVAPGVAGYLLLGAGTLDAADAHRLGIVHELVPADELTGRVEAWVSEIAESAPGALNNTKGFLHELIAQQLARHAEAGSARSAAARGTEEAREGLQAFLDKREPRWVKS